MKICHLRIFVKAIYKIPAHKLDRHFKPQYYFIEGFNLDFVGKFENLEKDFKEVMKKAGIRNHPKLPHKRKSKKKKDYKDYYNEETKRLVQEKYKKDFELFGYSKELDAK